MFSVQCLVFYVLPTINYQLNKTMHLSYKYHTFNVPLWVLRLLKRHMCYVRAAGGIVMMNEECGMRNKMLLIRRNGRWDLPKGKVEPGETLLQAAFREVEEETGIKPVAGSRQRVATTGHQLSATSYPLPTKTYHLFRAPKAWLKGSNPPPHKWHLKQTSWFPMTVAVDSFDGTPSGTPQQEEGITAVVWVTPDEWHRRLQSSYGTLRTLSLILNS